MAKANEIGKQIAIKLQTLQNAVKSGPKDFGYDASKAVSAEDRKTLNSLSDKKTTMEFQIKNNLDKVTAINKGVQGVMSKTRQVADGSANAETELKAAFDRIVNRAFALAQSNDVPAREMKAAISNLDGDLSEYAKATSSKDKADQKTKATNNLRMAKVQQGALKSALEKGKVEIEGLLKSMPANIVNRQNPNFTPLYVELDKALKAFQEDTATLAKETTKLNQLEPRVKQLV